MVQSNPDHGKDKLDLKTRQTMRMQASYADQSQSDWHPSEGPSRSRSNIMSFQQPHILRLLNQDKADKADHDKLTRLSPSRS